MSPLGAEGAWLSPTPPRHGDGRLRPRSRVTSVVRILERRFATPDLGNKPDPVEELVFIALTRQTHEANANRSWTAVAAAGGPEALVGMTEPSLVRLIRDSGLARQKAHWIRGALRGIKATFGELSLRATADWTDREIEAFLCTLPGVGLKSAKCVMMFSLGRAVLPVDVHVRRVSERIGLVPIGLSEPRIHAAVEALVRPDLRFSFHVNAVCLGRTVCRPARPRCRECPLARRCEHRRLTRTT